MARALGQRRFVSGIAADGQRVAKDLASKSLRCLRQKNRLAGQCLPHVPPCLRTDQPASPCRVRASPRAPHQIPPPRRLSSRSGRRSRTAARRRGSRPHRVPLGDMSKRVGDRVLPSRRRRRRRGSALRSQRRYAGGASAISAGKRHDDRIHARMREKCRDASLENRPTTDQQQLFRTLRAEALTASTGRDDSCDKHRIRQTSDYSGGIATLQNRAFAAAPCLSLPGHRRTTTRSRRGDFSTTSVVGDRGCVKPSRTDRTWQSVRRPPAARIRRSAATCLNDRIVRSTSVVIVAARRG